MGRLIVGGQRVDHLIHIAVEHLRHAGSWFEQTGHRAIHRTQGDAARLPFADASFDRIVSADALEHLPEASPAFEGVAVYANWLTDASEWRDYRSYWLTSETSSRSSVMRAR